MRIAIIEVEKCGKCPHCIVDDGYGSFGPGGPLYECMLKNCRPIKNEELESFPRWCPLEKKKEEK